MELPSRAQTDRFVPSGDFQRACHRLRDRQGNHDIPTLLVTAFDHRTRMLPFLYWDRQIVPAGIRAVSAAMAASGFTSQRVVNQAWTPNVRATSAKIDGRSPQLLLVSAMQIHSKPAFDLIRDARSMGKDRPLIVAGGPKAIYQPWDYFGFDDQGNSADVVCTGEEFVLLELFDRLLESKRQNETLREGFERARTRGWLDDIPGLVYDRVPEDSDSHVLVDTGVQRLVKDFDELPSPVDGYRYLEAPHRRRSLDSAPIPLEKVRRYSKVASILTTRGCKFRCSYCPIPAYNQFSFRTKTPEGFVRDIGDLRRKVGFNLFFGTDDNFFNDEKTVIDTFEALARAEFPKDDIGTTPRFGTEATEFDVYKQKDQLALCYRGGLRAIWFGIEDMTAILVNKGQSVTKTQELFQVLRSHRIQPMAMMMHYDGQPLRTKDSMNGLLNQVGALYKMGAASVQVTVLGPASGTKDYDEVMKKGIIFKTLDGKPVDDYLWDGNHVISVGSSKPWQLQRNVLLAYGLFYNPWHLTRNVVGRMFGKAKWGDVFLQLWGIWGLLVTAGKLLPWLWKLRAVSKGAYTVHNDISRSRYPIEKPTHADEQTYVRQTIGAEDETGPGKAKEKAARPALSKY